MDEQHQWEDVHDQKSESTESAGMNPPADPAQTATTGGEPPADTPCDPAVETRADTVPLNMPERVSDGASEQTTHIAAALEKLSEKVEFLSRQFAEKIRHVEYESRIVDQLHRELQTYKEDLYSKLIRPVLLDIIEACDGMIRTAEFHEKKPEGERLIPARMLADCARELQDILEKHRVEVYRSEPGGKFVPVRHRVVRKVDTDRIELHGIVAESLSCGYSCDGKTLSPEKVAVYYCESYQEQRNA